VVRWGQSHLRRGVAQRRRPAVLLQRELRCRRPAYPRGQTTRVRHDASHGRTVRCAAVPAQRCFAVCLAPEPLLVVFTCKYRMAPPFQPQGRPPSPSAIVSEHRRAHAPRVEVAEEVGWGKASPSSCCDSECPLLAARCVHSNAISGCLSTPSPYRKHCANRKAA